jgi:hypothetical protein
MSKQGERMSIGSCFSFCHSLRESASALASASAFASEIGPGFSPDISGTTTKGFSPWDFLS